MKKDVLINIRGVYSFEDQESDVIELFTTGQYYKEAGSYYIAYDESEATGFEGAHTVLEVSNEEQVVLSRSGSSNSQLIVQNGVRHQCCYDIGYGDMTVGISGHSIHSSLGDHGGDLEFRYSLDIDTLLASENQMYINVKECATP